MTLWTSVATASHAPCAREARRPRWPGGGRGRGRGGRPLQMLPLTPPVRGHPRRGPSSLSSRTAHDGPWRP